MEKKKVTKFLKDYQGYIILIIPSLLAIIRPIRLWFIEILNVAVSIRVWSLLIILIVVLLIGYLSKLLKKKKKYECKFEIGCSVQHKGDNKSMCAIEFDQNRNRVLCSWIERGEPKEKWFNQSALEKYEPIDYPLPSIVIGRSNNRNRW